MKRYDLIAVALTISLLTLTGCGKKNEISDRKVDEDPSQTLSFFGNKYEPANVEVIENILNGYIEENKDINITYESLKGSNYYDALHNRESSGNLDDLFMINHNTFLEFSENGSLADLSDLADDIPFSADMQNQMKAKDGKTYWLPTTVSAFGLYCNLDLLKEHGQKVPATLDEWIKVCDSFVSQGITPIIANNDISLKTLAIAKGFYPLYKEGIQAEVFSGLNSQEENLSTYLTDGFALAKNFCEKGYIDAAAALETEKTSDDLEAFVEGRQPFMLTGVWAAGRVKGMDPAFTFKVVPYPVLDDGSVLVVNPDVRLSVSAKSGAQEAAQDFISYFFEEENLWKFTDNQSSFSPLEDEYAPSLDEIQDIVSHYQTQTPVIGSDSHIDFPIWDITANVSKKLLAGQNLTELMRWMDEQAVQ